LDIASAILTAIVAGGTASAKDTASQAIKDAYAGLRRLLVDVYKLTTVKSLDRDPKSSKARSEVIEEVSKSAVLSDKRILESLQNLTAALEKESPARLADWDINLGNIVSARNVLIEKFEAEGSIDIGDIEAKSGDVILRDLRAGVGKGKK
jgi:hypothetical protein